MESLTKANGFVERFEAFTNDPEAFRDAIAHLTNGGTLAEFSESIGIRYSDLMEWVRLDAMRLKAYNTAMSDRCEWARETVYNEIKKIAMDSVMKPTTRLRAFELLGKSVGMFYDKRIHEAGESIADIIMASMIQPKQ